MLRLDLSPSGPEWVDLGLGVRVQAMPLTASLMAEAMAHPDMADADPSRPEFRPRLSKALGQVAIIAWEGVGDAAGAPIEPSPPAIAALLDNWMIEAMWRKRYVDRLVALVTEGNASAPAPSGTSAAGATIAETATQGARTAPH